MDRGEGRSATCWQNKTWKRLDLYISKVIGRGVPVDLRVLEFCIKA
jgi:hypothetical protein